MKVFCTFPMFFFWGLTYKSSDCLICAHEKVGNSMKESNNDSFNAQKVDYPTPLIP
jgi:hypothetical protein